MKKCFASLIVTLTLCLSSHLSFGQLILNGFSSISYTGDPDTSNSDFQGSWLSGSTAQFTQSSGFITITPVSGGDPKGDGSALFSVGGVALSNVQPVNLGSLSQLSLTLRLEPSNTSTSFTVQLLDSNAASIGSVVFPAASFNSVSFTSVTLPISFEGGSTSSLSYFFLFGDSSPSSNVRASIDQLAAVPEPSTWALVGLGLGGILLARRRRVA